MTNTATFDFSGARALVTGGTSGIGHAIATALHDAGASVTITGTRERPDDYAVDLTAFAYRPLRLDDPASVDDLATEVVGGAGPDGAGPLDVLVCNAGANLPGGRDEWGPDAFADAVAINLNGTMRLAVGCHRALRASSADGGASVVMLSSMAAARAQTIVPGYGAAKAGIESLVRALSVRWQPDGIRVNAIAPGLIDTPMTAPMAAFPELLDAELHHIPMGRMGTPSEVASAALFLSSSAASYVTGTVLPVDGGYLTH